MSIDRSIVTSRPDRDPLFTHVKAGMTVIIEDNGDWWMADVIHIIGSTTNPKIPKFFPGGRRGNTCCPLDQS